MKSLNIFSMNVSKTAADVGSGTLMSLSKPQDNEPILLKVTLILFYIVLPVMARESLFCLFKAVNLY